MQHVWNATRRRGLVVAAGAALLAIACVPVKPAADYRKAAELAGDRTGSQDVYNPTDEAVVQQRVEALLADGLTVNEAVACALLNNRELQAAFLSIGVSRAEVVQASLPANPAMTLLLRFPEGGGRADVDFGIAQSIVELWQIPVRKKIAKAELEATILDIARQAVTLAADVRSAAYRAIALRQSETTVRENLELVKQSEELAKRRFEAGEASQIDVNLARTETLNVQLELLQIQRDRRLAEAQLFRLLGLAEPVTGVELHDVLPEPAAVADEQRLLQVAREQRLDAQAAEARALAAEKQVEREWLNIVPAFGLGFDIERTERRALPGRNVLADTARESIAAGRLTAPSIQSRAERKQERRQEIDAVLGPSIEATLPLWDQNQAQIAKACYLAAQQRKRSEDLLNQIASEVHQAYLTLENAREIVQFYRQEALPQAGKTLDNARRLYQAGEQGIVVVIEAQASLITQRRGYVSALGDYAAALAELERAVGGRIDSAGGAAAASRPAAETQSAR